MIVGYFLMSSDTDTNAARVAALEAAGATQIFSDELSRRPRLRSAFEKMVLGLKPGDVVLTPELIAFSRSLRDLVEGLLAIGLRGGRLHCLAGQSNVEAALSNEGLTILSALTRFERRRISEQTRDGLIRAQKMGRGAGRPVSLSPEQQEAVQQLRDVEHWPVPRIAAQFGVSTRTIYRIRRANVLI